jgi:hypothetical protein
MPGHFSFIALHSSPTPDRLKNPRKASIQVHFQFYPNRNHAAAKTLERLATTLPPAKYWRNISCISGKMDRYFVRLAFGRK